MAHMFTASIVLIPSMLRVATRVARRSLHRGRAIVLLAALAAPVHAAAQGAGAGQPATQATQEDPTIRVQIPPVTVTAQKEEADKQKVPVSVTAVPSDTIEGAGIHVVGEAAIFAPNTYFTEWSARKLSNARFRGIGSSPNNPGITTYLDGVPQLNANSSSIELLDIEQIEFVRGPQSALYGRNTLGGLVTINSTRPSMLAWRGELSAPFGNHAAWAVRGAASGPLVRDKVSLGVSFAQVDRDGFTVNDITTSDIDSRSAFTGKAQVLWRPDDAWEGRVIVTGERARDGDYSLADVNALRQNPFHAARDFEGHVDRDVFGTTILATRSGGPVTFSSTTGFLRWKTQDVTDLDYSPAPALTRDNTERDFQFTQEIRFASATTPVAQGNAANLRWQSGVFFFTQSYEQDAINSYAAGIVAPTPGTQHTPRSELDDFGIGVFGQATLTLADRLDISGGARFDYEDKSAILENFWDDLPFPPTRVDAEESFSNVSPQASVAYRFQPDVIAYGTVGRGYKAGGFNPASPVGSEAYGEELTWNFEGGVKTLWAGGRVSTNAAVFYIDWDDLQLNVSNPAIPAQFYVANIGGAVSKGVELEVGARAAPDVDLFTAFGYTHARFGAGSSSNGVNVEGNTIPNTPNYTVSAGVQYSRSIGQTTIQGRADTVFYGDFQYNDQNTLGQEAYSLVNLRLAVTWRFLLGELLVRNAFDTEYIPIAFRYPGFAPSGFMGEMGAPRTVSVRAGVRF
jgi:iron complex outermembrane receptor protein